MFIPDRPFSPPTALSKNVEIKPENLPGASVVKKILLRELSKKEFPQTEELDTGLFYIKQAKEDLDFLTLSVPPYYESGFEDDPRNKGQFKPEARLSNIKKLYERYCNWFNTEIPGFIPKKMFFLSKNQAHELHGYIIKPHIPSIEDKKDDGKYIGALFGDILRSLKDGSLTEEVRYKFLENIKEDLPNTEQKENLKEDIHKFVKICRELLGAGVVIDLGLEGKDCNLRITPEGHLRMIDTDSLFEIGKNMARGNTSVYSHIFDELDKLADTL